jgi:acyl-CoA dehydrogenase
MWNFETEPEFQETLDWADDFVTSEVEPLDLVISSPWNRKDPIRRELFPPLQAQVKERGLWACHLDTDIGGPGYGQLKLALLNEIIGRARCGPNVFGCQAPDAGNSEVLARFGTPEQKERYLVQLLGDEIGSAFSMTEPQGGSDPKTFVTKADWSGAEWILNGEKWFTSEGSFADFLVVMAVTEPDAEPYRRMSMFLVPAETPGVEIVRDVGHGDQTLAAGEHSYIRYSDVRLPAEAIIGRRGDGFLIAQTRLGGGRVHNAMRTMGLVRKAFDMMCERAISRFTQGEKLADKQLVQEMIADSWIEMEQLRLFVLQTAWKIDKYHDYKKVRADIAAVKALMPGVLQRVSNRALQIHGALGVSNEMPFVSMVVEAAIMGLGDGATEVHKVTIARQLLRNYRPSPDMFPSSHLPRLRTAAEQKYAATLAKYPAYYLGGRGERAVLPAGV